MMMLIRQLIVLQRNIICVSVLIWGPQGSTRHDMHYIFKPVMIKKSYQDRTQVIEIFVSRPLEELDDSKKKSIGIQPSLAMYQ